MSVLSPPSSANVLSPPASADRRSPWTAQSQPRNPLSQRLYKVLHTNYDDEATKSALRTISAVYASQTASKGKQVIKEDGSVDVDSSLNELAVEPVLGESAARARKHLRRDMEQKLAEGSQKFLQIFGQVNEAIMLLL